MGEDLENLPNNLEMCLIPVSDPSGRLPICLLQNV